MNLIDTHAHLFWDSFIGDFDEVIQQALDNGITTIINVGVDTDTSQKALEQVGKRLSKIEGLTAYCAIGIHPHEETKYSLDTDVSIQKHIDRLEKIYESNPKKVIAIGECGLDFFFKSHDFDSSTTLPVDQLKALQIKLLQAQIDLAKKLNLPLLIHCRDDRSSDPNNTEAWDKIAEMTKSHFGIYHCYSGLPSTTNQLLQTTNFYFSFAANITYPNAKTLHETVKTIPLDRILTETDCPFLPPQEKRGERNEPANVLEVAKKIAEIKGISIDEVSKQLVKNLNELFAF
jgi:TatD DNase family protein